MDNHFFAQMSHPLATNFIFLGSKVTIFVAGLYNLLSVFSQTLLVVKTRLKAFLGDITKVLSIKTTLHQAILYLSMLSLLSMLFFLHT